MSRLLKWGLIAFVVFYVATQPVSAANLVSSAVGGLETAATGFGNFVSNIKF